MKIALIVISSLLLIIAAMALPTSATRHGPCTCGAGGGRLVESGETSGVPCRLVIEGGPETKVDRGTLAKVGPRLEVVGRFRYWDEPQGPTLYVYDDVQDLVGRIVNPRAVHLLQPR